MVCTVWKETIDGNEGCYSNLKMSSLGFDGLEMASRNIRSIIIGRSPKVTKQNGGPSCVMDATNHSRPYASSIEASSLVPVFQLLMLKFSEEMRVQT